MSTYKRKKQMNDYRNIITPEFCLDHFDYEEGRLFWKKKVNQYSPIKIGDEVGSISLKKNRSNPKPYRKTQIRIEGTNYHVPVHSLVWIFFGQDLKEGEFLDHINGDTLDNRPENLRIANDSQNGANRGIQVNNTSGYKGVFLHSKKQGYEAKITRKVKGKSKNIYLGYFKCPIEAAKAYDKKAKEIFGEYAYLNFSEENLNVA